MGLLLLRIMFIVDMRTYPIVDMATMLTVVTFEIKWFSHLSISFIIFESISVFYFLYRIIV